MKRIFSFFIFISLVTAYSVFAEEVTANDLESNPDATANSRIDAKEISQTMKRLNDLLNAAHPTPKTAEAFDQTEIQNRSNEIINSMDEDSDD